MPLAGDPSTCIKMTDLRQGLGASLLGVWVRVWGLGLGVQGLGFSGSRVLGF